MRAVKCSIGTISGLQFLIFENQYYFIIRFHDPLAVRKVKLLIEFRSLLISFRKVSNGMERPSRKRQLNMCSFQPL